MKQHICHGFRWLPTALALMVFCITSQTSIAQSQDDRFDSENSNRQYNSSDRDTQSEMRDRNRSDQYKQGNERRANRDSDSRDDRRSSTYRNDTWNDEQPDERDENDTPAGLGVMLETNQDEVEVREVAPNSPADKAGIARGDQILSINGRSVEDVQQVTRMVREEKPGSQIEIRIRRDGEKQTVTAKLESLRQALDSMDRNRQEHSQFEERFYGNSPPWDDDEILRHVDMMERQVERMQEEIEDLRSMLNDDPSQRRFSTSQRERRGESQRMRD